MATNAIPPLSDAAFVALFDLQHPHLSGAQTAEAILQALASRPLQACTNRAEMIEVAQALTKDAPAALEKSKTIVERATGAQPAPVSDPYASPERFLQYCDQDLEVRDYPRRGRGWYHLALLYAATNEPRWAEAASKLLAALPVFPGADSDEHGPYQGLLSWHPGCPPGFDFLGVAHVLENMAVTLPIFWPAFSPADRRKTIEYLARHAEIFHRGMDNDPSYNIPFHGLVAAWGVGALFPELRGAARWKAQMDDFLAPGGRYGVYPYRHEEGFFSEHLGYQVVNQMLMTRCFLLYERGWGGKGAPAELRRQVEAAYEFAAGTLSPDGSSFLLGDHQARSGHEHELDYHESLHLGAALFNRPDLKARAGGVRGTWPEGVLCLLMGAPGYRRWREMPAPDLKNRAHASTAFSEAGFFHLRAGSGIEAACHGLLSAALSPNHAHHDCIGVTLFGLGRELLSDSGFLSYAAADLARQQGLAAHAVCRLGHLNAVGARHEQPVGVTQKRFRKSACGRIQVACATHNLYPNYLTSRALILCLPEGAESGNGIWFIWDRLVHAGTADGTEPLLSIRTAPPARVTDTVFPLHSPGGTARIAGRSGWSCHSPKDLLRRPGSAPALALTNAQGCQGIERADNDANLQVTALEVRAPGATQGVEVEEGVCGHFVTPIVRPVLSFKWRGRIPHESVYVLLPFRGQAETPPWSVTGWCARPEKPGAFEARVCAPAGLLKKIGSQEIIIRASGLADGASGGIELCVEGSSEAKLPFGR